MDKMIIATSKQLRRVGEDMSFVGMHNTNEGIIAFADSKATIKYDTGVIEEDFERSPLRKIFSNNQFIFVTFGNNEIFSEKDKMNIEDYIDKFLVDNIDYRDFFTDLNDKIQQSPPEYNDGVYNFIIGSKDYRGKYFIVNCTISINKDIYFSEAIYEKKSIFGGSVHLVNIYSNFINHKKIPIHQHAKMIKTSIEYLIKAKDVYSSIEYNPVGLPVQIEIFQ